MPCAMPAQPKHIRAFELRLEKNWSSEDVVSMLTPDFVGTVLLQGFGALEPTIKVTYWMLTLIIYFYGSSWQRAVHSVVRCTW